MTTNVGDKVRYFPADGREHVEADVTGVNEDGSVNILYPHPLDEEVRASADGVQPGTGAYHFITENEAHATDSVRAAEEQERLAARAAALDASKQERVAALTDALRATEEEPPVHEDVAAAATEVNA